MAISGLGYYPNLLTPDQAEARVCLEHLKKVIAAARLLGVGVVNTFVGRDWTRSVDDNWPRFLEVWRPLIQLAESHGVRIAIENCPMLFTRDEWPGGKNLAYCPAIWRRMFEDIPSRCFGLNYDPSHLIWQQIDYVQPLYEFRDRIFHVHAKDAKIERHRLDDVGILATPLEYHRPKLPGLGDVPWNRFFSVLTDIGYQGPVCVEVEDRAFEADLDARRRACGRAQLPAAVFWIAVTCHRLGFRFCLSLRKTALRRQSSWRHDSMDLYVGVDLGGTNMHAAIAGADGRIVAERSVPTLSHEGPSARSDADGSTGRRPGRSRRPASGRLRRGRAGPVGSGHRHDQVPAESAHELARRAPARHAGLAGRLSSVLAE